MSRCESRITCLQRGYLSPDKGNLAANLMFWCAATIDHPVEVINVVLKCFHNYRLT